MKINNNDPLIKSPAAGFLMGVALRSLYDKRKKEKITGTAEERIEKLEATVKELTDKLKPL